MLAYLLAIVIALGSFSFYMAAFFVPEVHRRQDFVWSGVGMFYALVLWVCADRFTGAVLLGQIASVSLLGWLGWQTLGLRRTLTPEAVRTPTHWGDVQRWLQAMQAQVTRYIDAGSLWTGAGSLWADTSVAIAALRHRIAGPRGSQADESGVPPVKRSPAYEFETEPGQGEPVPSEFATVPTRSRPAAEARDAVPTAATDAETEAIAAATTAPDAGEAVAPAAAENLAPETETPPSRSEVSQRSATTADPQAARSTPPATKAPAAKSSTPPSRPAAKSSTPPKQKKTNPVTGLAAWVGDVVKSARKPKPARGVIEIPPRPPSIPRSPDAASSPAQPSPTAAAPRSAPPSQELNWVDVGEADAETNWPAETHPPAAEVMPEPNAAEATATVASPTPPEEATSSNDVTDVPPADDAALESNWANEPLASPSSTNWDELESNWLEDAPDSSPAAPTSNWDDEAANWPTAEERTTQPDPAIEAPETNWPEDEDRNWPD